MVSMENAPPVLALVRDLLFVSRITTSARATGRPVEVIRLPKDLSARRGCLLLADLNLEGAIEAAAAWKQTHGGHVIGFVSHADADTIAKARDAGIDRVMARSAFVEALPALLINAPA